MQFHIVQLGRYSSAITHYTGAQTTNTRHTRGKKKWESGNCPLYKPWSGWGVGAKPQWNWGSWTETQIRRCRYGPDCQKCLITPSRRSFVVTFADVEMATCLQKATVGQVGSRGPFSCRPWSEGTQRTPLPNPGLERLFWMPSWAQFVTKETCDFLFAY